MYERGKQYIGTSVPQQTAATRRTVEHLVFMPAHHGVRCAIGARTAAIHFMPLEHDERHAALLLTTGLCVLRMLNKLH